MQDIVGTVAKPPQKIRVKNPHTKVEKRTFSFENKVNRILETRRERKTRVGKGNATFR